MHFRKGSRTQTQNANKSLEEGEIDGTDLKKNKRENLTVGSRVLPSSNWTWGNQNDGNIGTVITAPNNGKFKFNFLNTI